MFGYGSPTGSASSSYSSSYSSYASFSSATASPMDIKPSPFSSRGPDASCAFPSWPRRSTLSDDDDCYEEPVSSYLSDEDLLFTPDTYEDDSSSNASASPMQSPQMIQQFPTEAELFEMQRQKLAYQREIMKVIMAEKEQRKRQAAKRRAAGASKKSKSSKSAAMTPIAE